MLLRLVQAVPPQLSSAAGWQCCQGRSRLPVHTHACVLLGGEAPRAHRPSLAWPPPRLAPLQLPAVRPNSLHRVNKSKKTVHRAYGGHLAAGVVKERIVRAFLVEEQKIVKKVLKESQQKKR